MKFGKLSQVDEAAPDRPAGPLQRERTLSRLEEQSAFSPPVEYFQESIVQWHPGHRVEIRLDPPNLGSVTLVSGIMGLLVGSFGTVLIAKTVLQDQAPADYLAVCIGLSAVCGLFIAGVILVKDRGSRMVLDWDTFTIDASRRFSHAWSRSLHDIKSVIVRCVAVDGKTRRYRAAIELDVTGKRCVAARTAQLKRKADVSRKEAKRLADPLATALGVPIQFEAWEDVDWGQ